MPKRVLCFFKKARFIKRAFFWVKRSAETLGLQALSFKFTLSFKLSFNNTGLQNVIQNNFLAFALAKYQHLVALTIFGVL